MRLALVRYGSWRWMVAATLAAALSLATVLALRAGSELAPGLSASTSSAGAPTGHVQGALSRLAADHPNRQVEVIVENSGTPFTRARWSFRIRRPALRCRSKRRYRTT